MAEKEKEKKDPHRERIEELGRMNSLYVERPWEDWRPSQPPVLDHFTHDEPEEPKKG